MLIQFIHSLFWVQKNSTQGTGQFLSILRANGELVGIIVDGDDGGDVHEVARLETDDPADVRIHLLAHARFSLGFLVMAFSGNGLQAIAGIVFLSTLKARAHNQKKRLNEGFRRDVVAKLCERSCGVGSETASGHAFHSPCWCVEVDGEPVA